MLTPQDVSSWNIDPECVSPQCNPVKTRAELERVECVHADPQLLDFFEQTMSQDEWRVITCPLFYLQLNRVQRIAQTSCLFVCRTANSTDSVLVVLFCHVETLFFLLFQTLDLPRSPDLLRYPLFLTHSRSELCGSCCDVVCFGCDTSSLCEMRASLNRKGCGADGALIEDPLSVCICWCLVYYQNEVLLAKRDSFFILGYPQELSRINSELYLLSSSLSYLQKRLPSMTSPEEVSILSWNILARCYFRLNYRDSDRLKRTELPFRREKILHELERRSPDFACFQEMDDFYEFWFDELQTRGYQSLYVQRPYKKDGCCIAYGANYECEMSFPVNYNDLTRVATLDRDLIGQENQVFNRVFEDDDALKAKEKAFHPQEVSCSNDPQGSSLRRHSVGLIAVFRNRRSRCMARNEL